MSAGAEELLHQIYWHHAELDERTGPIVTENLNPKRLEEDILKFVALDSAKANNLVDLKALFAEFESLSTKRNRCLHWIWDGDLPGSSAIERREFNTYRLKRPLYKQKGEATLQFRLEDIWEFCKAFGWLSQRLRSHTYSDDELRDKRAQYASSLSLGGVHEADLLWPAPWLDKSSRKKPSSETG
jgi:hypothetical protein